MTVPAVTRATGKSLQRLAEQAWERTAAGSVLYFEGTRWTGLELAERVRRMSGGLRGAGPSARGLTGRGRLRGGRPERCYLHASRRNLRAKRTHISTWRPV